MPKRPDCGIVGSAAEAIPPMTNPRQRLRARGLHIVEPTTALAARQSQSAVSRNAPFYIELNGTGVVTLLEYSVAQEEFARIDFSCLVAGTLRITVDREPILEAETYGGTAFVTGLFFKAGARVVINFSNLWTGLVAGTVSISPSPEEDKTDAARDFFGLPSNYTAEDLAKAYKTMVFRWHPDRAGGSHTKLSEANFFHRILKDKLG
jgi:hypothetical protein